MKTINNYDQSSTGTDIKVTVGLEQDWSFDENFKILESERGPTKAYYIDYVNVEDDDSITFTIEGTKEDIEKALIEEGYTIEEIKLMNEGEPLDILETSYGEKITLLNFEDFNKAFNPIMAKPSKNIEVIKTHGYSQGDVAWIYYCPDDLEKAWGKKPNENELEKLFHHYFWDSKVYACVTINGEEFSYYDQLEFDEYEWEPEKFIKYISEKSGVSVETLSKLIPYQIF